MNTGIYRIKNCVTDMVYIGQAFNFQKRWKNHRIELNLNRHSNRYLQSAWNKYGSFNFEFSVIECCDIENLTEREQYWIDKYKSAHRTLGYNLHPIAGGSMLGFKASDETKQLLSEMKKGKPIHTEESKAAIGAKSKGRVFSAESREKMRQSQLGKKQSEETKAKRALALLGNTNNKGGPMSEEHKQAISKANKGREVSEDTRNKIAASNTGLKRSAESRAKMSAAALKRWNDC